MIYHEVSTLPAIQKCKIIILPVKNLTYFHKYRHSLLFITKIRKSERLGELATCYSSALPLRYILCPLIISTFSWGRKRCVYYEKVLIWRKSACYGKWRVSHLRYSLYRIDSKAHFRYGKKGVLIMRKVLIMSVLITRGHSNRLINTSRTSLDLENIQKILGLKIRDS